MKRLVLSTRKAGRCQQRGRSAGWAVALVVGIACLGTGQTAPESPSAESLRQRVTAFWEARIQGDDIAAYQYEIFAHTGALTVTQYVRARSPTLKYMSYTIDTIQEQEDQAQVTVTVQYRMDIPGMVDFTSAMPIQEGWVRLADRQWYRKMKPDKPRKTARQQD